MKGPIPKSMFQLNVCWQSNNAKFRLSTDNIYVQHKVVWVTQDQKKHNQRAQSVEPAVGGPAADTKVLIHQPASPWWEPIGRGWWSVGVDRLLLTHALTWHKTLTAILLLEQAHRCIFCRLHSSSTLLRRPKGQAGPISLLIKDRSRSNSQSFIPLWSNFWLWWGSNERQQLVLQPHSGGQRLRQSVKDNWFIETCEAGFQSTSVAAQQSGSWAQVWKCEKETGESVSCCGI